jgi:hypothetical protein
MTIGNEIASCPLATSAALMGEGHAPNGIAGAVVVTAAVPPPVLPVAVSSAIAVTLSVMGPILSYRSASLTGD